MRVLLDTNVLIYSVTADEGEKHHAARRLIAALGDQRIAVSSQVLSEYANVLTHGRRYGRDAQSVQDDIADMLFVWEVFPLHGGVIMNALEAHSRWQLPYYDAQIWAAAALNAIPIVLSEDFQDGAVLGGVRFMNPFAEGFDPAVLLEPDGAE